VERIAYDESCYAREREDGVRALSRREKGLVALATLATVGLLLWRLNQAGVTPLALAREEPLPPPVPRIDLARLGAERPESQAGQRDLFAFGAGSRRTEPTGEVEPAPVTPAPAAGTSGAATEGAVAPLTPTVPALNLRYLGSVESRSGVKVAVLLTDRREVLTGQAGEVVANRYRIARIGLESVDLEDIGSGQARRIPLRGN
jgi:hypothetical protein